MSRLSNALNMYMILQGRRLVKVKELAEIIEVSPRMIKEYKNDLEKAGIYINSKKGRNGGYYLENRMDLKGLGITKEELNALKMANEAIKSGNHIFALDFEILTNKILNAKKEFSKIDYFSKDNLKSIYMQEKEKELWEIIRKAIINNKKVEMQYGSLSSNKKIEKDRLRIVHPYGTFDHEGSMYYFGYCELRKEVRFFKFTRILEIQLLEDKFTINIKYDIKDKLRDSFGIFDDDMFDLKLKILYPMSQIVKEKQYTLEENIIDIDEETIIYEARLKGYKEVKSWVLSMGSNVEVLEPKKLREDVVEEIRIMQKAYG